MAAAIVVFGPPLGDRLFPDPSVTFWPSIPPMPLEREHTEQARFLLALMGPLLLTGVVLLGLRRAGSWSVVAIDRLVVAAQVLVLGFAVVCIVVQYRHVFVGTFTKHTVYFRIPTLVAAAAIAAAIGAGLASDAVRQRVGALLRESRTRKIVGICIAVAAVAIWVLPAINTDDSIGNAHRAIREHMTYWLDEVFALLDGRYPLVGYVTQYGALWPFAIGGAMRVAGASLGVFTTAMVVVSGAAMLAVFATFRRIVRSTVGGLALFLPFLATSFYMMQGPLENRYAIVNLFGTFPLRYAGPLLLVWLLARHLDAAAPRRAWWVFVMAGLVLVNNVEFGAPAFGATVAALLWARAPLTRRSGGRLALEVVVGLGGAAVLVCALTLLTAGSLPHLQLLVRYSRLFAFGGWGLLPMTPAIGVSTIIYGTYVAAIGVGTVRAVNRHPDRLMTGLLVWSGMFGLGIGSYYIGRSHPEVLTNMFAAWALSVTLLFVVAVRAIAARPSRRPMLAEGACLVAFGVLVCSLAQTPTPWSQVDRLREPANPIFRHPYGESFIAHETQPGDVVAIYTLLGHRVAYENHLVDVTPYAGGPGMPTIEQFDEMLNDLRAAGGTKVFFSVPKEWPGVWEALEARGFHFVAQDSTGMVEFVAPW